MLTEQHHTHDTSMTKIAFSPLCWAQSVHSARSDSFTSAAAIHSCGCFAAAGALVILIAGALVILSAFCSCHPERILLLSS